MSSNSDATCPYAGQRTQHIPSRTDAEFLNNPYPHYSLLRSADPLRFDEKLGMWLVSRYEDLQTVLRDSATFSLEQGYKELYAQGHFEEFKAILERDGGGFFPDAIMTDPPYHTGVRRLMDKAFTARRVKELEPVLAQLAIKMIDTFAAKGRCDAVNDFAVPLTIGFICEQMGFEHVEAENIKRWSAAVVQQISGIQTREEMVGYAREICDLQQYIIRHVRDREDTPREDMISDLVHARMENGERLTFEETVSLVRAMLVAGNETTAAGLSKLVLHLATRPGFADQLWQCVDDDRKLGRFIEEFLRFDSPIHGTARVTTKDVELGGKLLPKGSHLLLLYGSGNRDAAEFEAADSFDATRPNLTKHVTFGAGAHRCIGAALARMEIKIAARELAKRLDNIQLALPSGDLTYVPSIATHSLATLPITFSRRTA